MASVAEGPTPIKPVPAATFFLCNNASGKGRSCPDLADERGLRQWYEARRWQNAASTSRIRSPTSGAWVPRAAERSHGLGMMEEAVTLSSNSGLGLRSGYAASSIGTSYAHRPRTSAALTAWAESDAATDTYSALPSDWRGREMQKSGAAYNSRDLPAPQSSRPRTVLTSYWRDPVRHLSAYVAKHE